jgi:hypothetical protein
VAAEAGSPPWAVPGGLAGRPAAARFVRLLHLGEARRSAQQAGRSEPQAERREQLRWAAHPARQGAARVALLRRQAAALPGRAHLSAETVPAQPAAVAHSAQQAVWEWQPVAAQPVARVAQPGPRPGERAAQDAAAVRQLAGLAALHAAAAQPVEPAALHAAEELVVVVAAVPDAAVAAAGQQPAEPADAEVLPAEGAAVLDAAVRPQAAEGPSGAVPLAAAWAFRRDRFPPAARLARRPKAHPHSVRARRGLRGARR